MSCATSTLTVESAESVLTVERAWSILECGVVVPDVTFIFAIDPDDNFFVDGFHNDLLTQLTRIEDLSVISRTSVIEYRDNVKNLREIDKLAAEIRQIRSDTTGSLFWLKMIALFVTVGGAVGGYLRTGLGERPFPGLLNQFL